MPNWKKLIISGSNAALNSVTASNGFFGTASYAINALTASYVNLLAGPNITINYQTNGIAITGSGGGSGATFNGGTNVDNRIVTATGNTPGELNGEANLTFNGSTLAVTGNVTANSFTGSLRGSATTASLVQTGRWALGPAFGALYPTFVTADNTPTVQPEELYTNSSIFVYPGIGSVTATSFTGSLSGSALHAITASYALSGPSGGSTTPGGSDTQIQYNSGSTFAGSSNLTYLYSNTGQGAGRLLYRNSDDFAATKYGTDRRASLAFENDPNGRKQQVGLTMLNDRMTGGTGATNIFAFDAGGGGGGGATILVTGFKCDYCLSLYDSTYFTGTRTGTLWGAWDYDTGQAPTLYEISNNGDISAAQLVNATFTLVRNGTVVELHLDLSGVGGSYEVYYNLFMTVFTQTLVT